MAGSSTVEVSSVFWQQIGGKNEVFELDIGPGVFFEPCETLLLLYETSDHGYILKNEGIQLRFLTGISSTNISSSAGPFSSGSSPSTSESPSESPSSCSITGRVTGMARFTLFVSAGYSRLGLGLRYVKMEGVF